MIIVFSRQWDESSLQVYEWLIANNTPFLIVYPESQFDVKFLRISDRGSDFEITIDGTIILFSEISGVWYRRGQLPFYCPDGHSLEEQFIRQEYEKLRDFFLYLLQSLPHINIIECGRVNKLTILHEAVQCGLTVPFTLISGNKRLILDTFQSGSFINKAICENSISHDGEEYILPVHQVAAEDLHEQEGLSLYQSNMDKLYELRVFHFFGKNYAMAIFSQMHERTIQDFRFYDLDRPNRWTPYKLPDHLELKINQLMKRTGHNTGSLDFIYTGARQYVFLEINPIGQYDMISETCNYDLHKMIADKLTEFYHQKQLKK